MRFKQLLILIAGFVVCSSLQAQDIHFTQYYMSPMTLNPGMIGKFEGTVRIGGIYRDQWASIIKDQFQTPSAFVDAPIVRGFRKRDWVGVGFMLYNDRAGTLGLTHGAGKLGASYHFALDKKGNAYLSIGAHYGGEQRKVDVNKATFEDGILNAPVPSADIGRVLGNAQYNDIDGGVVLTSKLNKRMDFNIGFSMYHIFRPNYNLISGASERLPRRSVVHGQFNMRLTDRFSVNPNFLFQTMSGADEIILQGMGGYLFDPERDIEITFGVGYRLRDAVNALVGGRYKDLRVGIAYDINTSQLNNVSRYRGGFEIAANYIIRIYKPAVVKPNVICPRY